MERLIWLASVLVDNQHLLDVEGNCWTLEESAHNLVVDITQNALILSLLSSDLLYAALIVQSSQILAELGS